MPELFPTMRICADAVFDVAYAALAGTLLNRVWLGRHQGCDRQLGKCLIICSTILVLVLPLQFLLLSASMTGDISWTLAWGAVPDVATTHSGHSAVVSFCLVASLLMFSLRRTRLGSMKYVSLGGILTVGFIASRAFHGHAASDGDFTLREGVQFLHLSATATWAGGVLVAGLITVPQLSATADPESVLRFGKRLSGWVTIALAVVIVSGMYNSWKGLDGTLSPVLTATWGRMLVFKLCFVFAALVHGIRVRLLFRSSCTWTPMHVSFMRRWMRSEAVFIALILICSSWLANTPPPNM